MLRRPVWRRSERTRKLRVREGDRGSKFLSG